MGRGNLGRGWWGWRVMVVVLFARVGAAQPVGEPRPALAGPRVEAGEGQHTGARSIVEREAGGELRRLEIRPEVAAARALDLPEEARAGIEALVVDRYARVARFTKEHYELFLKVQGARQAQDRGEIARLGGEMREQAGDLIDPPLLEVVEKLVPADRVVEYRGLVGDYVTALVGEDAARRGGGDAMTPRAGGDEARGLGPRAGQMVRQGRMPARMEMQLLIREMAMGFAGMVESRKERMNEMLKAVDATPEQEAKIRAIVREEAEKGRKAGGGTPEVDRGNVLRRIGEVLTPEQRRLWREHEMPRMEQGEKE